MLYLGIRILILGREVAYRRRYNRTFCFEKYKSQVSNDKDLEQSEPKSYPQNQNGKHLKLQIVKIHTYMNVCIGIVVIIYILHLSQSLIFILVST